VVQGRERRVVDEGVRAGGLDRDGLRPGERGPALRRGVRLGHPGGPRRRLPGVLGRAGDVTFAQGTSTTAPVGGTVPATLSLTLGAPATFGAFTPGVAKDYTASTTADVVSTAATRRSPSPTRVT
jgi:hypothetical protein